MSCSGHTQAPANFQLYAGLMWIISPFRKRKSVRPRTSSAQTILVLTFSITVALIKLCHRLLLSSIRIASQDDNVRHPAFSTNVAYANNHAHSDGIPSRVGNLRPLRNPRRRHPVTARPHPSSRLNHLFLRFSKSPTSSHPIYHSCILWRACRETTSNIFH